MKVLFRFEDEKLLSDENNIRLNISNYLIKEFINEYSYLYLIDKEYKSLINVAQEKLDNEMNSNADAIGKSLNSRLKLLNFDKELAVRVDSRGGKKYAFKFQNSSVSIGTLSDGQKHKLALAIFLESISSYDLTKEIVVIDDPVITLDFKTYYSVKEQIKDLTKHKKVQHLILLTHNVTFLYLQISDFFNKDEIDAKMYRLFGNTAEEVDINLINYDDITLYKKGLTLISNLYEFNLVANMNVRIFRYFLDLRSRIEGIPDNGNPSNTIESFSLKKENCGRLKQINSDINKLIKDKESTNSDLLESFSLLKEAIELLQFPKIISDEDIIKLKNFSNDDTRTAGGTCSKFIYDILEWIYKLFNNSNPEYKSLQNYMNHPRLQLTKTLIGLDFSDNDGKFDLN